MLAISYLIIGDSEVDHGVSVDSSLHHISPRRNGVQDQLQSKPSK